LISFLFIRALKYFIAIFAVPDKPYIP